MSCKKPLNRVVFADGHAKVCGTDLKPKDLTQLMSQNGNIKEIQKIGCGQCFGCRMEYAREWATRCEIEMRQWEHNWFLTLTYDDEHLPRNVGIDTKTGEVIDTNYLVPEDLTQFMKSLRQYWQRHYDVNNIRFYACGEYGDRSQRAHYHVILFNIDIPDIEPHHKNTKGNMVFTSKIIEHIWGRGIIGIGIANWETAAYTAQYMLKKQKGKNAKSYYADRHITPEFTRMSRMPGIAAEWYKANKDKLWQTDEIILAKGRKVKPPSYYDKLYDLEIETLEKQATNEEDCRAKLDAKKELRELIRRKRKDAAIAGMQLQMEKTSLTSKELLRIQENAIIEKYKNRRKEVG